MQRGVGKGWRGRKRETLRPGTDPRHTSTHPNQTGPKQTPTNPNKPNHTPNRPYRPQAYTITLPIRPQTGPKGQAFHGGPWGLHCLTDFPCTFRKPSGRE